MVLLSFNFYCFGNRCKVAQRIITYSPSTAQIKNKNKMSSRDFSKFLLKSLLWVGNLLDNFYNIFCYYKRLSQLHIWLLEDRHIINKLLYNTIGQALILFLIHKKYSNWCWKYPSMVFFLCVCFSIKTMINRLKKTYLKRQEFSSFLYGVYFVEILLLSLLYRCCFF